MRTDSKHWSDDFFGQWYKRFDQLRHNKTHDEIGSILGLLSHFLQPATARLTELCCGYGRLLLPLAVHLRHPPQGIDKSAVMLEEAKKAAIQRGLQVSLARADLRYHQGDRDKDVVLLLATSFGYYCETAQDSLLLRSARSILREGGLLILDQFNNPPPFSISENDSDCIFHLSASFNRESRIFSGRYTYRLTKKDETLIRPFFIKLYSREDLTHLLTINGFKIEEVYGHLDGRSFSGDESERIVVLARAA